MNSSAWARPRLKAHLSAQVVGPEQVLLLSEECSYLVAGAACVAVVPYLDGQSSLADIVAATADRISFSDCVYAVSKFHRSGHLADGDQTVSGPDRPLAALWESQGLTAEEANARQQAASVVVTTVGSSQTYQWSLRCGPLAYGSGHPVRPSSSTSPPT